MAESKIKYASATNLTVTSWGTGLAAGQYGFSAIVDNTTNLYMDALVGGLLEVGTTTPAAGDTLDIYVYGMYDEATSTALTGAIDALYAGTDTEETEGTDFIIENMKFLTSVTAESNVGFHWGPESIAQLFGGVMPPKWGLVLHNNGSATMAAGSLAEYIGITYTSA